VSENQQSKDEGLSVSIALMIIGAIFFVYTLFVEDNSVQGGFSESQPIDNKESVFLKRVNLPLISLEKEINKEIIASIPYIYLEGDLSYKEYNFPMKDNFDYLEAFYEIKERKNAVLGVYINDFMVSFNREGNNYYKLLEKPIFENKDKLNIRFIIKKEGFFGEPVLVIKDFVIVGYENKGKKIIDFYLDKDKIANYYLIGEPLFCRKGSFILKVNNCPEYVIKFDCRDKIKKLIPDICFNEYNKLTFELQSGEITFKKLYLEEAK